MPDLCVIVPVHNNATALDELVGRCLAMLDETEYDGIVALVDDGSTDHSWDVITTIAERDDRVAGVRIVSRRGQAAAGSYGVRHFRPRWFVFLDADLEYWPEDIPLLVAAMQDGADVVCGVRPRAEHRSWWRRGFTWLHGRLAPGEIASRIQDPGAGLKGFTHTFYDRAFPSEHLKEGMLHLYAFATSARRIDNVPIRWTPNSTASAYSVTQLLLLAGEEALISDTRWPRRLLGTGVLGAAAALVHLGAVSRSSAHQRDLATAVALGAASASLAASAITAALTVGALRAGAPPYAVEQCGAWPARSDESA